MDDRAHYYSLIVSCSCFFREGCDTYSKVANMLYEGAMRLVITIVARVLVLLKLHINCKQWLVDPITVCGPLYNAVNKQQYN